MHMYIYIYNWSNCAALIVQQCTQGGQNLAAESRRALPACFPLGLRRSDNRVAQADAIVDIRCGPSRTNWP